MNIMSMAEIMSLLREQARLRAQENDEAGILLLAADFIQDHLNDLGDEVMP